MLISFFTAALVLTVALGLALALTIRWHFRHHEGVLHWSKLRYFVSDTPRGILKTTALVAGFVWLLLLWISTGIALHLPPLAITLGVAFLALSPFVIAPVFSAVRSWREQVQARRKCGYLIGQRLRITHVDRSTRGEVVIACCGPWVAKDPADGSLWEKGDGIEVIDIVNDHILRARRSGLGR